MQQLYVPQYEGLKVDAMLQFTSEYADIYKFLPD